MRGLTHPEFHFSPAVCVAWTQSDGVVPVPLGHPEITEIMCVFEKLSNLTKIKKLDKDLTINIDLEPLTLPHKLPPILIKL